MRHVSFRRRVLPNGTVKDLAFFTAPFLLMDPKRLGDGLRIPCGKSLKVLCDLLPLAATYDII